MEYSRELPREAIHDWPPMTDCCPSADAPEGLAPLETRTDAAERRVVALYRHELCGREWTVTWNLGAEESAGGVLAADVLEPDELEVW